MGRGGGPGRAAPLPPGTFGRGVLRVRGRVPGGHRQAEGGDRTAKFPLGVVPTLPSLRECLPQPAAI